MWTVETSDKGGNGTAKLQPIKVDTVQGQLSIIDSGLVAGQQIVVDGADRLRADAPVVVSQARGAQPGTGTNSATPAGAGAGFNGANGGRQPHKEQQ